MPKSLNALLLMLPVVLARPVFCAEELPDTTYRATILVRDFESPNETPELGALAAEAVGSALEKGGLARAVRPEYRNLGTRDSVEMVVEADNVTREHAREEEQEFDVSVTPQRRLERREISAPASEYVIEGAILSIGDMCRIRALLRSRVTGVGLLEAVGDGRGDHGLLDAADEVARQFEQAYRSDVLERRAEGLRRAVLAERMPRSVALDALRAMDSRWPVELAPAAVAYVLVSGESPANGEELEAWRTKVIALLPTAGSAGERLLMRLGLNPHEFLERTDSSIPDARDDTP